jgi:hypothetical protein
MKLDGGGRSEKADKLRKTVRRSGALTVARGRGSIAREAARTAAYMAAFGLIAYFGMKAVIKIEATKTRLFLVIVIFGVGFGAAALLDHLRQRLGKTSRCLEGRRA